MVRQEENEMICAVMAEMLETFDSLDETEVEEYENLLKTLRTPGFLSQIPKNDLRDLFADLGGILPPDIKAAIQRELNRR